jgi:hypothetical protein
VSQEEGELVVYRSFPVVQVGVADTTGFNSDQSFAGTGIWHQDALNLYRRSFSGSDYSINLVGHFIAP